MVVGRWMLLTCFTSDGRWSVVGFVVARVRRDRDRQRPIAPPSFVGGGDEGRTNLWMMSERERTLNRIARRSNDGMLG